jgi:hypothetical protein
VKKLMSQNGVVLDISLKDKSRLKRGNNLREKDFCLFARILEIILYMILQRLIGLNW